MGKSDRVTEEVERSLGESLNNGSEGDQQASRTENRDSAAKEGAVRKELAQNVSIDRLDLCKKKGRGSADRGRGSQGLCWCTDIDRRT